MTKHIPGIRYSISAYIISDSAGFETVVTIDSPVPLPPITGNANATAILASLGVDALNPVIRAADDWRLMTDAEIAQYKESVNA